MSKPNKIPKQVGICQQCFHDYSYGSYDDGFCGDDCLKQYEKEIAGEDEEDDDTEEEE